MASTSLKPGQGRRCVALAPALVLALVILVATSLAGPKQLPDLRGSFRQTLERLACIRTSATGECLGFRLDESNKSVGRPRGEPHRSNEEESVSRIYFHHRDRSPPSDQHASVEADFDDGKVVPLARRSLQTVTCLAGTTEHSIDFDTLPSGVAATAGTFVDSEWKEFGVEIVGRRRDGKGGFDDGNWARLFDSSAPPLFDRDLGSPNKNCPGCLDSKVCPGFSRRNGPGFLIANVTNCVAQNNILIIHQGEIGDEPNDNVYGGMIEFVFDPPIRQFLSLGILDVNRQGQVIEFFDSSSNSLNTTSYDGLGDNTFQEVEFPYVGSDGALIETVEIELVGALTKLRYCVDDSIPVSGTTAPAASPTGTPTGSPSVFRTGHPTVTPTAPPSTSPSESPTLTPTVVPTTALTPIPPDAPTELPTVMPTTHPTDSPTEVPTATPMARPTDAPTEVPTATSTERPTDEPTEVLTATPTATPTDAPTEVPTATPTTMPIDAPTEVPTVTSTAPPTDDPTISPTMKPTSNPTDFRTTSPMTDLDYELVPRQGTWIDVSPEERAVYDDISECSHMFKHCCVGQCRQLAMIHSNTEDLYRKWSEPLPSLVDVFSYMETQGLPCHVVFVGDSLAHDHVVGAMCELSETVDADYEMKSCFAFPGGSTKPWGEGDVVCDENRHGYIHFEFDRRASAPGLSGLSCPKITISYSSFNSHRLDAFAKDPHVEGGVMLLNYGVHCRDETGADGCLDAKFDLLLDLVQNETYSNWVKLWREHEPSHYNTVGGSWEGEVISGHKFECKATDMPNDWRNIAAAEFIKENQLQVPTVPIFDALAPAAWLHEYRRDCTHYCYSPWRFQLTWDGIIRGTRLLLEGVK